MALQRFAVADVSRAAGIGQCRQSSRSAAFDPALDQPHHAIGAGDDVHVVRHHDDSQPVLPVQVAEQADDLAAGVGVEVAGRLVGQEDARPIDEGAGDGGPLHLAAGQLARPVVEPMAEADAVEQLDGPVAAARGAGRTSRSTDWAIICGISTFSSVVSSGSRW